MFDFDYKDELQSAISYYREFMPQRIKDLIGLASYDLWHGPIFYDPVSLDETDDSGIAFPFQSACNEIREWMDSNINPIQYESSYDEETEESQYEDIDDSERDIIAALCGKALFAYI